MDKEQEKSEESKKEWTAPELTVHGDAAKITQESPTSLSGHS
jgi:hypothetical protein